LHDIETVGGVTLMKHHIANRAGNWAQG
jgi:hypothetical protein